MKEQTYVINWCKTYYRTGVEEIKATSIEDAERKAYNMLGDLEGSLQYDPDNAKVEVELKLNKELKCCPFCNKKAVIRSVEEWIGCQAQTTTLWLLGCETDGCFCNIDSFDPEDTDPEELMTAWNNRANCSS